MFASIGLKLGREAVLPTASLPKAGLPSMLLCLAHQEVLDENVVLVWAASARIELK